MWKQLHRVYEAFAEPWTRSFLSRKEPPAVILLRCGTQMGSNDNDLRNEDQIYKAWCFTSKPAPGFAPISEGEDYKWGPTQTAAALYAQYAKLKPWICSSPNSRCSNLTAGNKRRQHGLPAGCKLIPAHLNSSALQERFWQVKLYHYMRPPMGKNLKLVIKNMQGCIIIELQWVWGNTVLTHCRIFLQVCWQAWNSCKL